MKRIWIVPLVMALVALTCISGILMSPKVAHAQPPPPAGFHIEVNMLYCLNHVKTCNTPSTIQNSEYIEVLAVSFTPGLAKGTPDGVDFTCGRAYIDSNGVFHDVAEHVFAGFEGGTITGEAELEGNYATTGTDAIGELEHVQAFDPVTGDSGTAWGMLETNNTTGLRIEGGFKLRLNGPIYDESTNAAGQPVVKVVGNGEVECNSYGRYVPAPFASGPLFIAQIGGTQ